MLTDESGLRGCGILGQVLRYGQPATVWVATEDDGFPLPLFVRSTFKAGGDRVREDRDIVCAGVDPGLDRAAGKNVEPFVLPLPPEGLVSGSRRREAEHRVERECGVFGESAEVSLCVVATEFTAGRPRPVHIATSPCSSWVRRGEASRVATNVRSSLMMSTGRASRRLSEE